MKAHVMLLVALAVAGACLVPGCHSYREPPTGAEVHYCCETLKARLDAPIEIVYDAAARAVHELCLQSMRAAQDGISGQILAFDAQRDVVDIQLGAVPEGRTLLTIRVGVFGDKPKSIVLFNRIMRNLRRPCRYEFEPPEPWHDYRHDRWDK